MTTPEQLAREESGSDGASSILTTQEENLNRSILGTDDPDPTANDELSALLEGATEEEEPTEEPTEESTVEDNPLPPGLTPEAFESLSERARAMEILEEHPDVLNEAVQKIRARHGLAPSEGEETQTQAPANQEGGENNGMLSVPREEWRAMQSAVLGLTRQVAIGEHRATVPNWNDLAPEVQKLQRELPGVPLDKVVEIAKRIHGSGGELKAPPLRTSEVSQGANSKSKGSEGLTDNFSNAQKKVMSQKTTRQAADTALAEALKLERLKEREGV